jgi:hypothetical protein
VIVRACVLCACYVPAMCLHLLSDVHALHLLYVPIMYCVLAQVCKGVEEQMLVQIFGAIWCRHGMVLRGWYVRSLTNVHVLCTEC